MDKEYLIKKYLHDELSQIEKKDFLSLIENDKDFAAEVEIQSVFYAKRSLELKKELNTYTEQNAKQSKTNYKTIIYRVAAIFVIGIIALSALKFNDSSVDKYASKYLEEIHNPPSVMMSNEQEQTKNWRSAIQEYRSGNFSSASQLFNESINLKDRSLQARLYTGLSYLYQKPANLELAQKQFDEIIEANHLYVEEAKWYKALILLDKNELSPAKQILESIAKDQSWNHSKANVLLTKIGD